jgi:hypothetical protein
MTVDIDELGGVIVGVDLNTGIRRRRLGEILESGN